MYFSLFVTKSRTLAISPSTNHNPICHWYSISEPWPQLTTDGYIFKVEKYTLRLRTEVCLSDQTLIFLVTWTNKNQPYLHRDNRSRTALRGRMRGWQRLFSEWQAVTDFNHITVIYCWYIYIGNKFYLFINVRTITLKKMFLKWFHVGCLCTISALLRIIYRIWLFVITGSLNLCS